MYGTNSPFNELEFFRDTLRRGEEVLVCGKERRDEVVEAGAAAVTVEEEEEEAGTVREQLCLCFLSITTVAGHNSQGN